ncbi:MAG: FAD-binding protein [Prevotella sp.]|nr:FAD-binding protein [Prevotella sp.]
MIKELQVRVVPQVACSEQNIADYVSRELAIDRRTIKHVRVLKRSIDARQRQVMVNLTLRVYVNEEPTDEAYQRTEYPDVTKGKKVIVVGEGPCGLFAALRLIERGIKPIVIERGKNVRERKVDLAQIKSAQRVDSESNYSFGEGGAGAYSDGKLYTRSKKRGSVEKILNVFCQFGASTSILADAHPHIGTDKLPRVIEAMRNQILECGGEVHFQTKMTELIIRNNKVCGVIATQPQGGTLTLEAEAVILATGHSARDVYRYLAQAGIDIEAKGIAVGVRLEHPAELIDQIQYHNKQGRGKYLPAAEYSFVTQVDGRGVYSFCMCPGGFIVPAATDREQIVVNGMSPSNRGGRWSNSGMVVEVRPEDVNGNVNGNPLNQRSDLNSLNQREARLEPLNPLNQALAVVEYQEELERMCWQQGLQNGGKGQTAPAQRMADFVKGRLSYDLPQTSYTPGVVASPLHFWMPKEIATRLQKGFEFFGKQRKGFLTNEALMIGVETRTSAPVRILRDNETLQHVTIEGLFPAGEGAGYAGGIVSAGVDGERVADMVVEMING